MENIWTALPAAERDNYIRFHETAYKDDLKHAEDNAIKYPRWAIISGYYAMHDATKLFLAKKFAIKISSPEIHEKAIKALKDKIQDEKTKKRLLEMLEKAKEAYFNIERLKEKVLPEILRQGRHERGKTQYYSEDYSEEKKAGKEKAVYFLDKIVNPYIQLIEGLMQ
ncbi:MAG: hypothetical protein KJ955_00340 [Nanoarchaeota archaeon]|nr:hypothetical protein [Nanoarchaeota archaeon]